MRIDIYSSKLVRKASFFTCVSLLWQPKYNEAGAFQIEFAEDSGVLGLIKPFDYVTTDFDGTVMLVTSVQYKDKKILINGKSAIYLLSFRTSTAVIRNKNAEEALRGLISEMIPWDGVTVGELAGIPDKYTAQTSDGSIYKYCTNIAQACDMGVRIRKSGRELLFECYKPGTTASSGILPPGYTQLEYILSDGQQYIDTGVYPNGGTKVVADCDLMDGIYPTAFGAWTASNIGMYILLALSTGTARSYYGDSLADSTVNIMGRHTLEMDGGNIVVDGSPVLALSPQTFTCANTLYLFTYHGGETMESFRTVAKYYSCLIYDNGVLVRQFVPCKSSDSSVGLYDIVNNKFYNNSGEGSFIAGPVITHETNQSEIRVKHRFAAELGNMGNETYTESELDYANVAIVAGAGSGDERVTVTAGAINSVGVERREVYFDARHIQPKEGESDEDYRSRLVAFGEGKLAELSKVKNTSFSIIDENVSLGDLVVIKSVYSDAPYRARVTGLSYKSQGNTLSKTISVGTGVPMQKRG